ncbi:hypothetical protein, partial [Methanospirillum hungatei]|uniref:hypothetical protein n=1 Tax=Methanospirillum hungatei TaxID=2203 RepID=UPI0026EFE039
YPHYQYSYVRTDTALKAFVGSPLKRPLTLLAEGYILSHCPSRTIIPRPLAPDDSGSMWDNNVVFMSICSCRNESDDDIRRQKLIQPCHYTKNSQKRPTKKVWRCVDARSSRHEY